MDDLTDIRMRDDLYRDFRVVGLGELLGDDMDAIVEAVVQCCKDYHAEKTKLMPVSEYHHSMGVVLWVQKIGDGYNYVARRKQGDLTHEPGRYDHFQLINIEEGK